MEQTFLLIVLTFGSLLLVSFQCALTTFAPHGELSGTNLFSTDIVAIGVYLPCYSTTANIVPICKTLPWWMLNEWEERGRSWIDFSQSWVKSQHPTLACSELVQGKRRWNVGTWKWDGCWENGINTNTAIITDSLSKGDLWLKMTVKKIWVEAPGSALCCIKRPCDHRQGTWSLRTSSHRSGTPPAYCGK